MSLAVADGPRDAELNLLERLRAQYEEKGYTFVVHPSQSELPPFLQSYQPDAIARKGDRNVAIEIKSRRRLADHPTIQKIRKLFEGHPDWQLTVAYSGVDELNNWNLPLVDKATVLARVSEARELASQGHLRPSLVMAWSLLEAALNSALPESDKRPRMPGTVVQSLAMNGYISPETEQELRRLVQLRNQIVHGDFTVEPDGSDIDVVLTAVASTLSGSETRTFEA